jgi:hypothetical protein
VADQMEDDCPKRMVFGPCGGVRPDHSCEVDSRRCPFTHRAEPRLWPEPQKNVDTPPDSRFLSVIRAGRPAC